MEKIVEQYKKMYMKRVHYVKMMPHYYDIRKQLILLYTICITIYLITN